jgi:hypothetical protein
MTGVLLLLLAVWVPSAHASRALPTVLQDDAIFLHGTDRSVDRAMGQVAALGVERVRITAGWGTITRDPDEPVKPAGFDARDPAAYDRHRWRPLDRAVRAAAEHGVLRMVDIGFWAPRWATAGDPEDGERPRTGLDADHFADFAAAVATRYSGLYVPPGEDEALPSVGIFALWNEPNHPAFLLPQYRRTAAGHAPVSPHAYRTMVRKSYPLVKAAAPRARVLIGNTSAKGGDGGRSPVAPLAFIRALACVDRSLQPVTGGACADFPGPVPGDGWAHHPYALGAAPDAPSPDRRPDDARLADLPRMAALLDRLVARGRLDRANRDIYITEFGYETDDLPGRPGMSESEHARSLTWSERIASRVPSVRMFAQFLLRDITPATTRQSASPRRPLGQFSTGLHRAGGQQKIAARTFVAGLHAERRGERVELWGRLRLGRAQRRVRIERSQDGGRTWRPVTALTVSGQGGFTFATRVAPDALYRLRYRTDGGTFRSGLPVRARPPGPR